ncbi:speckle targeted PIP5K1A-regulated poly(A) polymerase-like [Schistocerca nitens]|uniref:speckle targeted PIP5K1A-regulated poly(A) polymerase-like n=1 Tax=Schistocerca nitens TaxID=7011 RepID=UPI002118FB03|nr:speckle targeted PIP5K1A-regulated poly(A) polymerase-like [Schistocerca nitens]
MDDQYRACNYCKIPVPACKFHEHLKTKAHRERRMASKLECGVYISQLPLRVTKEILVGVLERFGRVRAYSLNSHAGTAIVYFEDREAAEALLKSSVHVLNQLIHTEPISESNLKKSTSPEAGINNAAIIFAVEQACQSPSTNMEEHIGIVLDFIILRDPARDDKVATIVEDLEQHLAKLFPDCRAELFGSAVTGLTLPGDAIDISICDGPCRRSVSLLGSKESVTNIRKLLLNFPYKFANIGEIPDASEPVIRFLHRSTHILCNLVINYPEGPRSSRQLRWVLCLDERIRLIMVFIKYWAKSLKLISNAKFSSYAMTVLVLFYLQQIPEAMVPALRVLHDKNIPEMAENITNKDPLRILIEEFFGYFSEVRLEQVVLAPYVGDVLDREIFIRGGMAIPPEMQLYNIIMYSGARPLMVNTPMVLQDPYQLNVNLTSRVDEETVSEFQIKCKQAYEMVKTGNLLHLLKAHCSSTPSEKPPSSAVVNTSFKAARFLQPNYLVPEPQNEVVLAKKELFQRWLNVMFVILPDFLINFVRLQVEPQDVPAEQNFWEPRAKVPRLSEESNSSKWNSSKTTSEEGVTKKWLCRGCPVVCSWQHRKKVAVELELAPSIHPMEREVLISKYLEQSFRSEEVSFYLTVIVDEDKEMVRCLFENLDRKTEPFSTVAHALVTLLPLWINNAFEVGFSLRCVTGIYIPGDMQIGASRNLNPSGCW